MASVVGSRRSDGARPWRADGGGHRHRSAAPTIRVSMRELQRGPEVSADASRAAAREGRVRSPGGGRKSLTARTRLCSAIWGAGGARHARGPDVAAALDMQEHPSVGGRARSLNNHTSRQCTSPFPEHLTATVMSQLGHCWRSQIAPRSE